MQVQSPAQPAQTDALPGFNVLLIGPAGSGKTHAIGTLAEADPKLQVFYLSLEPGRESLAGFWRDKGKPIPDNVHWRDLPAPQASFNDLISSAKSINLLSLEALAKQADPNRGKYNRFITLLEQLNNFKDDRTGQSFGAVDTWGTDKVLVIDGMTGINNCAMSLVIGGKPVRSQSDWGIAQDQVEKIVRMLTEGCKCHVVILAHVERETDMVMGGTKLMVASLGKALAPKLPPMFSDVILAARDGVKWSWDTGTPLADVKARNLPFASGQPADFKPLVEKWKARGGVIG